MKTTSQTQLLDDVIQRSWSLLPAAERDVLQQAMVFQGGFGLESAEAILWTDAGWIDDIIESLLDHSLLYCRMDTGTARYELYETSKPSSPNNKPQPNTMTFRAGFWRIT